MSKSKKLLEIIKKAVREEVRTVVREELREVLGNEKKLTYLLNKKKLHRNVKQIEKNYFYKYDFKASNRLQKILDSL